MTFNPSNREPTTFGAGMRVYNYIRVKPGEKNNIFPLGSVAQGIESKVGQNKDWHICDGSLLKQADYPELTAYLKEYSEEWLVDDNIQLPNMKE